MSSDRCFLLRHRQRIFEIYLNVIEWDDGIYGIEPASRRYFGKPASGLLPEEAAILAAMIPNPRRYTWRRRSIRLRLSGRSFSGSPHRLNRSELPPLIQNNECDKSRAHHDVTHDHCQCEIIHNSEFPNVFLIEPKPHHYRRSRKAPPRS